MKKQGKLPQRGKRRSPGGRFLSMFLALCMVLALLPVSVMAEERTAMFAVENVSIGDMQITEANAMSIQNQFDAIGSNIAAVTSNNGTITIKLLQDITGRIEIHASGNYIFDADGHNFSGGLENEAIGMGWNKNVSLELVGNGTYNSGVNNTLVVNNNTLIIKSATVYGKLNNSGTLNFALEDGYSYFTVKNNSIDLFNEKNIMTKTQTSSITGTGTGLVVAQYREEHSIGLDIPGTCTFSAATVGYGEQAAKTVTITNTGKQDISSLLIELTGSNFSISPTSISNIATGNIATFSVQPNSGLAVGTHIDTITVSNEFVSQCFDVSFTVNAAPDEPTNLAVTPGDGQLTMTWTAPARDGHSPIIRYEVSTDDGASWVPTGNTSTSYTVTGLTNGTNYTVKVRAVNPIGVGASSTGITAKPAYVPDTLTGTATISNVVPRIGDLLKGSLVSGNNTGTLTYVWKAAGTQVATGESYTVTEADLGKMIILEIKSDVEAGIITSALTTAVLKKVAPSAPDAPTLVSKTHNTVTLTANAAYEFSMNGSTWQTSNIFRSLSANTAYTFYQRKAETADTEASAASMGFTVTTNSNNGGGSGSGSGYKQTNTVFTDIARHWAKEDIKFVVSRGLFNGTSSTIFSPNIAMTRGMFVTALGRLANADVSSYKQSNFTDVKKDAYYMGYIEWASKNSIVNGTGNGKFAPDQSITREQMAVIMQNYGKVIGFPLLKVHEKNTFADSAKISAYAKDAMQQMQMAGVISGKNGNLLDPHGTATRAEISAVLRRFVELVTYNKTM